MGRALLKNSLTKLMAMGTTDLFVGLTSWKGGQIQPTRPVTIKLV